MKWLSPDMTERALWTGAQAVAALALTYLASIPAWWAAPIALFLSALKTKVLDVRAARKAKAVQA